MEIPKRYSDLAPGLTQTVYAGDELIMRDNDGNEFSVIAKEAETTMTFLKAFDAWFVASQTTNLRGDILDGMWIKVKRAYNNLPMSIQRELYSFSSGAVLLPKD